MPENVQLSKYGLARYVGNANTEKHDCPIAGMRNSCAIPARRVFYAFTHEAVSETAQVRQKCLTS